VELTFVVGTGRCGSTLLSQILSVHPDVLSVSEFLSVLKSARGRWDVPAGDLDGRDLWKLLSTNVPVSDGSEPQRNRPVASYKTRRSRYTTGPSVPLLCYHTLPMLTDDPDALYDQLGAEVPGWPRRPAAEQYRALFGFLARRLGRRVVVERSGASMLLVGLLRELFPEARFVHMYRDGPDCALSMSRHPSFRREALAVLAARAARATGIANPSAEDLETVAGGEFAGLIRPPYDGDRLMGYPVPVSFFAELMWSDMLRRGLTELGGMPADVWTSLKYEDLLARPGPELTRLAGFIGVAPESRWLEMAAKLIDPANTGQAAAQLDPITLDAVRAACEPGLRAIDAVTPQRIGAA
jgi:hypothetical protein